MNPLICLYAIYASSFLQSPEAAIFPATPISSKVVVVFEDLDTFPKHVFPLNSQYLLFPELRTNKIRLFDIQKKTLEDYLLPGEGPEDVNGGFFWMSEFQGKVLVQEINTNRLKLFDLDKNSTVVTTVPKPMVDVISVGPRNNQTVVHVLDPSSNYFDGDVMQKATGDALFLYQISPEGKWEPQGEFRYFEPMNDSLADTLFHGKMRVFPVKGTNRFVLVPMWGAPEIAVLDTSGNVVDEIPFPHPWASKLPKDPSIRLELYHKRLERSFMGASATSNGDGNIFILLDNLFWQEGEEVKNYSRRVIVKLNLKGEVEKSYQVDEPLYSIFIIPESQKIYALDSEREKLLFLEL